MSSIKTGKSAKKVDFPTKDESIKYRRKTRIKEFPKDNIKPENNQFAPEGLVQCLLNDNQLTRKAIALMLQELQNIEAVLLAIKNRGYL